jgi:hypothetical protein
MQAFTRAPKPTGRRDALRHRIMGPFSGLPSRSMIRGREREREMEEWMEREEWRGERESVCVCVDMFNYTTGDQKSPQE